jgi:hypothetical protein
MFLGLVLHRRRRSHPGIPGDVRQTCTLLEKSWGELFRGADFGNCLAGGPDAV